MNLILPAEN